MNTQISFYEASKTYLAQYSTVDQVKSYRDKAVAIEAYAKQACDYELEQHAARARIRAERLCGEMLLDMDKAKGAAIQELISTASVAPVPNRNQCQSQRQP